MSEAQDSSLKCHLAEYGLGVTNSGTLAPCCQWHPHLVGKEYYATWQDTERFNREIRPKILADLNAGIKHPGCQHCWQEEQYGHKSLRLDWNSRIPASELEKARQGTDYVLDIELSLGNLCNLRCMMCGPYASSLWATTFDKNQEQLIKWQHSVRGRANWWEEPGFMDWLRSNLTTALRIDITGGEPLIIPQTEEILEMIVEIGRADDIALQFNSNFTKVSDRILRSIRQIKHTGIAISLEGTGTMNDYVRYPSRWSEIESNVQRVIRDAPNVGLCVNHTLQHASVYSLPALIEWSHCNNLMLHLTTVQGHPHLGINGAPPKDLKRMIDWAEQYQWPEQPWLKSKSVKEYILGLRDIRFDHQVYQSYRDYIKVIDQLNSMSYDEIFQPSSIS